VDQNDIFAVDTSTIVSKSS